MDRSPLVLAALASAAVPGLEPVEVQGIPSRPGSLFDVAFVTDSLQRSWIVRAPRTDAAGAQMDVALSMLAMLMRRISFSVPAPKGFAALKEGGRAAVYPRLPGQLVDFGNLPAGPGVAAELGRTIAALHNVDHQLFEEAGVPVYDAESCRTRRLADLDRAASTGHVPTGLLVRWERRLEDVSQWRFAATPVHGDLTGDQVLAVFDDADDASTGRIRGLLGWEDAKVGDPAEDFTALAVQAPEAGLETVMEAYAHARVERPDAGLLERARLLAQMSRLGSLNTAIALGLRDEVDRHAAALRRLDEELHERDQAAAARAGVAPAELGRLGESDRSGVGASARAARGSAATGSAATGSAATGSAATGSAAAGSVGGVVVSGSMALDVPPGDHTVEIPADLMFVEDDETEVAKTAGGVDLYEFGQDDDDEAVISDRGPVGGDDDPTDAADPIDEPVGGSAPGSDEDPPDDRTA